MGGSLIYLEPDERMAVEDLFKAIDFWLTMHGTCGSIDRRDTYRFK